MIALVDYGAGNLASVRNAFACLGAETFVTRSAKEIASASRVVFAGVGAAGSAMANLRAAGLADALVEAASGEKPFLGICLGMQILFKRTEEDGGTDTLGVFDGEVRRFPRVGGFKVPQIGWNCVRAPGGGGKAEEEKYFYFVHSYAAQIVPQTALVCEYAGVEFTALVKRGRLWASQFHPEKSGRAGLEFLKEWLEC